MFLFVRYSRNILNYLERIILFDLTHMMSIVKSCGIGVETPMINSGCSLEKEFPQLDCMNT